MAVVSLCVNCEKKMERYEVSLSALGMKTDEGYSAVALEMDLWGFGESEREALEDLMENVRMQVSYALQIDDLSILDCPAPSEYQAMFRKCRNAYIKNTVVDDLFIDTLKLPNNIIPPEYRATA